MQVFRLSWGVEESAYDCRTRIYDPSCRNYQKDEDLTVGAFEIERWGTLSSYHLDDYAFVGITEDRALAVGVGFARQLGSQSISPTICTIEPDGRICKMVRLEENLLSDRPEAHNSFTPSQVGDIHTLFDIADNFKFVNAAREKSYESWGNLKAS